MSIDVRVECEAFLPSAKRFLAWADQAAADADAPPLRELHALLGDLQVAASRLPTEVGERHLTVEDAPTCDHQTAWKLVQRIFRNSTVNAYCVVFDALDAADRKAVMTRLEDDVADIYADVLDGILLYELGRFGDALWAWQFTYWSHWGRHLAHAQAAVYSALALGGPI